MKLRKRSVVVLVRLPSGERFREFFHYSKSEKHLELKFLEFVKEFCDQLIPHVLQLTEGGFGVNRSVKVIVRPELWFTRSAMDLVRDILAAKREERGCG